MDRAPPVLVQRFGQGQNRMAVGVYDFQFGKTCKGISEHPQKDRRDASIGCVEPLCVNILGTIGI